MHSNYWSSWAQFLRRWGLKQPAAALLETSSPLASLAAQLVYLSQPLLATAGSLPAWQSLGNMLEDPTESQQFAQYLRLEPDNVEH